MNWWIGIFAILTVLFMPGCSVFDTKEDIAVTPTLVEANTAPVSVQPTVSEATPIEVPRITQAQTIGILRELRANGCMITKFADTDGIQYSQLVVNCGPPQPIPLVE